jgi:hypothetical protein
MDWVSASVSAAIVAGLVSLVGGVLTAYVTTSNARRNLELERTKIVFEQQQTNRRPFFQKQLEICFEAVDAAARLASETRPSEWEVARLTFWRLYWGVLSIVENQEMENAMVLLGQTVPRESVKEPELPMRALQAGSLALAHAARDLMSPSWNVILPQIVSGRSPSLDEGGAGSAMLPLHSVRDL